MKRKRFNKFAKRFEGFRLHGKVKDKYGETGIGGLTVSAYDKDLLFDDRLGTTVTDDGGSFEFNYSKDDFSEIFDKRPELYVKATTPDGKVVYQGKTRARFEMGKKRGLAIRLPKDDKTPIFASTKETKTEPKAISDVPRSRLPRPPKKKPKDKRPDASKADKE